MVRGPGLALGIALAALAVALAGSLGRRDAPPDVSHAAAGSGTGGRTAGAVPRQARVARVQPADSAIEELTSDRAWTPAPGSPIRLFPADEWDAWAPTFEAMHRFLSTIEDFRDLDDADWRAVWARAEFRADFETFREHQGLRHFVLDHVRREAERLARGEASVPLERELFPANAYLVRHFGFDDALWAKVTELSAQTAALRREHGAEMAEHETPTAQWELFRLLVEHAEQGPFTRIEAALRAVAEGPH